MDPTQTTTATPPALTGTRFKFFSGTVKAYMQKSVGADGSEQEEMIIEGIASSNARDRYGDTMSAQCQASMLSQAHKLTMFGNHDYDVPEDVFGKCIDAKLETQSDMIDLAIKMQVAKSNPRAVQSWKLINEDEIQLAFSIGGRILDADIDEENDDGSGWFPPLIINDLELLEISLVGIPANPRAYTRSFLEDIKRSITKGASRDVGVQKAFLRSIGVKSVAEDFPEVELLEISLLDADAVNAQLAHDAGDVETAIDPQNMPEPEAPVDTPAPDDEAQASADALLEPGATGVLAKSIAEYQTERDAIVDEMKELSDRRDALVREIDDLEKKAQTLKATPVGAIARHPNGSTHTAATGKVDLTKMTAEELRAHTQRVFSGQSPTYPIDARASLG